MLRELSSSVRELKIHTCNPAGQSCVHLRRLLEAELFEDFLLDDLQSKRMLFAGVQACGSAGPQFVRSVRVVSGAGDLLDAN